MVCFFLSCQLVCGFLLSHIYFESWRVFVILYTYKLARTLHNCRCWKYTTLFHHLQDMFVTYCYVVLLNCLRSDLIILIGMIFRWFENKQKQHKKRKRIEICRRMSIYPCVLCIHNNGLVLTLKNKTILWVEWAEQNVKYILYMMKWCVYITLNVCVCVCRFILFVRWIFSSSACLLLVLCVCVLRARNVLGQTSN